MISRPSEGLPSRAALLSMATAIRHRGPDDLGTCIVPGAGLAATRLAILDVEHGHQPIQTPDGLLTIVFNGEIYNHLALKVTLEKLGYSFRTNCDTETVLYMYREFGSDCVKYLNGMFAFAIWDEDQKLLFTARDRLGIKPFYYTLQNGKFIFGSELKAILAHPDVHPQIDILSLSQYFTFEYVPNGRSIFKGIHKLPAGHTLTFANDKTEIDRYWDVSFSRSESRAPVRWSDYEEQLVEKLRESVKSELLSDVPVGVFLSGGLDSSAVAYMMTQLSSKKVSSFSLGFEDPSFDERYYARLTAQRLGTEHNELIVTDSMLADVVPNIAYILDEPMADSSIIPTYLLSKFTRQKVKVALSGDGGDEIFAGYPTYQAHRLISYYERLLPRSIRTTIIPKLIQLLPVSLNNISLDFKLRRFISGKGLPLEVRHHTWLGAFTADQKKELLSEWARLDQADDYEAARGHLAETDATLSFNKLLYCDLKLYLEGDILTKTDRASMCNSLEVRVPLLNSVLFDFVTDLPFNHKMRFLNTKHIFKRAMSKYLPHEIISRKKKGFNVPIGRLLNSKLKSLVGDTLLVPNLACANYINPNYIKKLIGEHFKGTADHRKLIWPVLVFELWYRKYITS